MTKIGASFSEKYFEYAPDIKIFSRVSGSKRFCISLTFNLIQNYIYPTKTFLIRSCIQSMVKCDVILNPPFRCKILATLVLRIVFDLCLRIFHIILSHTLVIKKWLETITSNSNMRLGCRISKFTLDKAKQA